MDEPTAALGVTEANKLLGLIRNLKEMGLSILLITQRIPDILAIADRVFVLKGGQRQDILEVSQVTLDDVVTMIVKGKDRNGDHQIPEVEYTIIWINPADAQPGRACPMKCLKSI